MRKQSIFSAALLLVGLVGCGGNEPGVVIPDNPAPPPGNEALITSGGAGGEEAEDVVPASK